MEPVSSENVVWLEAMERTGKVVRRGEPMVFLAECRDQLLAQIVSALNRLVEQIEQDLFDLAERSDSGDLRSQYLDAHDKLASRRALVSFGFRRCYAAAWTAATSTPDSRRDGGLGDPGLSLVDNDILEETIAVAKLSASLERNLEESLFKLTGRVALLLGVTQMDNAANPLRPRLVAEALHAALADLALGSRAKVAVVGLFERGLREELRLGYEEIEKRLARRLGNGDPGSVSRRQPRKTFAPNRRDPGADLYGTLARLVSEVRGESNPSDTAVAGAASAPAGSMGVGVAPGVIGAGGVYVQQGAAGAAGAHGAPTTGQGPVAGGLQAPVAAVSGFAAGIPPQAANSAVLLTSLTALQRGDTSAFGALALLSPTDVEAGSGNILHALRRTPLAREFPASDGVTFDIVAMLFDFIFEDEDISELMKARIGRLQVPMVKVALLDKGFFSSRQHPARQLIDLLAEVAQAWVPEGFNNERLLAEVDATIQSVLDQFETDVAVFAAAATRLTVFLEAERARERELAQASAHLVLARERKEIGRSVGLDEIERRLANRDIPASVAAFLRQHWAEVMAALHVRHGESAPEWAAGLATLDELLWSVEPKLSSPERNQLVARLPQLLRRLQSGMDLVEVPPAERNAFFTALVACHASAVKMGLRSVQREGEAPQRRASIDSPAEMSDVPGRRVMGDGLGSDGQSAPLLLTEVDENGVQLEEIRLEGERGVRLGTLQGVDEYAAMVTALKRGACVEFASLEGRRTRCKLAWVSPLRGIYLFTRQPGRQALSVSPEALAAALRSGEATILNDAPLFDRAVDSLLGALSPA